MRFGLIPNTLLYAAYIPCPIVFVFAFNAKIYAAFLSRQPSFFHLSASLQNSVCGYAPMFGWLSVYALLGK